MKLATLLAEAARRQITRLRGDAGAWLARRLGKDAADEALEALRNLAPGELEFGVDDGRLVALPAGESPRYLSLDVAALRRALRGEREDFPEWVDHPGQYTVVVLAD